MTYIRRIVDIELRRRLGSVGAVVIEGPKACGKTATARQIAASEVLLDVDLNARRAVSVDPGLVLSGDTPRLIDEWQIEPDSWNHIRRAVDERRAPGQFILTGSAVPPDAITRHTGAGRLSRMRMRPLSLYESGHASGAVSLASLLHGEPPRATAEDLSIGQVAERVCAGGWPGMIRFGADEAMEAVRAYLDEIRRVDIGRVAQRAHDPERMARLLASLGRNVATRVSTATLAADVGGADGPLAITTARDYLDALERVMIVEDQPAWEPHLRSRSRLRKSPKRHLVDPSLAVAALGANPRALLEDLELLGFLFESMVVRDLRVYAQAADAEVLHYQDGTGLEIDAIVRARDGRWAAFEVKLGYRQVDLAARNLVKLRDERVDTERVGAPAALGVIVPSGVSHARDDGVAVVSLGALGP